MILFLSIITLGLCGLLVLLYNRLVRDRQRVSAAWSDIDVQLQLRYNLIPQLVETAEGYARHERKTLKRVIFLRQRAQEVSGVTRRGEAETALGVGLKSLLLLIEDYPDLRADENFLQLQRQLSQIEDRIQYARRYYNGSVRNLNTRIASFPDLLLARLFGFTAEPYFELNSPDEAQSPELP